MLKYVDVVDGLSPLQHKQSAIVELMSYNSKYVASINKVGAMFKACYQRGATPSKIHRSIIETDVLIRNIGHTLITVRDLIAKGELDINENHLADLLEGALLGITNNCAIGSSTQNYSPANK